DAVVPPPAGPVGRRRCPGHDLTRLLRDYEWVRGVEPGQHVVRAFRLCLERGDAVLDPLVVDARDRSGVGRGRDAGGEAHGARAYGASDEVSTTSKAEPGTWPSVCRSSFDQRPSGTPEMYQSDPLSATIIPYVLSAWRTTRACGGKPEMSKPALS